MQVLEYNYQVAQIELRQRLQDTLDKKEWKQKNLALATGIDSVLISKVMNNKRRLVLRQLDAITEALRLQKDTFYEYFIGECFNESGKMSPVKTAYFFASCIKVERYDITKRIIELIKDDTNKKRLLDNTFKMAEHIFSSDQRNYSLPLYDIVIANSTTRNERVAISYFKRFVIARDVDLTVSGYKSLHQLLEYLPLLPKEYKLEAYFKILTFYNMVEKWNELLKFSTELKALAMKEENKEYIAVALLYEFSSYKGMNDLINGVRVIREYGSYGDAMLAQINETLLLIEMGHVEFIDEHLNLISSDPQKLFAFLPVAIEVYLQKEMLQNIQVLLQKYKKEIEQLSCKTDKLSQKYKLRLFQALATYYLLKGETDLGFHYNVEALELALMFKNVERLKSIMLMHYEYNPSEEHKEKFINIMTRGNIQYEKNINIFIHDSVLLKFYRNEF
ncbi:transcriptional regulator [Brevibacillus laterosporus]|uniref:transcriptional regulator n=1 Tax=Brevibacillus laterosporus TaxID=1465 RepID=UPI000B9A216A|nr:transcriptional regulator [Brevibacillus laterosporus]